MKFNLIALAFGFAVFTSCAPDLPPNGTNLDVVYTNFNPNFDFGQGSTFAIPDNVILVGNNPPIPGQQPPLVDFATARSILGAIRTNMLSRGFTQVNQFQDPDYILLPSVPEDSSLLFYYNWWFWEWWYPNLGAGLGWQYPGFRPATITSVSTGSLCIQLINMKSLETSNDLEVDWVVVVNGVLTQSQSSNADRAAAGVNQAFIQSPYIQR